MHGACLAAAGSTRPTDALARRDKRFVLVNTRPDMRMALLSLRYGGTCLPSAYSLLNRDMGRRLPNTRSLMLEQPHVCCAAATRVNVDCIALNAWTSPVTPKRGRAEHHESP